MVLLSAIMLILSIEFLALNFLGIAIIYAGLATFFVFSAIASIGVAYTLRNMYDKYEKTKETMK